MPETVEDDRMTVPTSDPGFRVRVGSSLRRIVDG